MPTVDRAAAVKENNEQKKAGVSPRLTL